MIFIRVLLLGIRIQTERDPDTTIFGVQIKALIMIRILIWIRIKSIGLRVDIDLVPDLGNGRQEYGSRTDRGPDPGLIESQIQD